MRFRVGLLVGFGTGYYLGTKAGRERYEQINEMVDKVKRNETFEVATEKAKSVVDVGMERAKDLVDARLGHEGTTGHGDVSNGIDSPYFRPTPET